jgi:hypothetical protein
MKTENTRNNPTAGIADPYWYEWYVGLYYALDLLDDDKCVSSVVLQSKDYQGLDDVMIHYLDDSIILRLSVEKHKDTFRRQRLFGYAISYYFGEEEKINAYCNATWNSGRIDAAIKNNVHTAVEFILKNNTPIFHKDLDLVTENLLCRGTDEEISAFIKGDLTKLTSKSKLNILAWAIIHDQCEYCTDILEDVLFSEL